MSRGTCKFKEKKEKKKENSEDEEFIVLVIHIYIVYTIYIYYIHGDIYVDVPKAWEDELHRLLSSPKGNKGFSL